MRAVIRKKKEELVVRQGEKAIRTAVLKSQKLSAQTLWAGTFLHAPGGPTMK